MPSILPDGDPAPSTGELPESALRGLGSRPFGFYVHVPFCVTRCGYCDFNTYTADELGPGAAHRDYADTAIAEIRLARRVLGDADLPVRTVFFGGGTPTLLPAADLGRILAAIDAEFGVSPGAEVTTEANPESVDPAYLTELRGAGFTRVSFGMQSAREHVLKVLDRRHTPGRAAQAVHEARRAGFEHVNLDLIYSTPGETDDDWRASLDAAIEAGPDHVSAYSLIVEQGTRLAARIRRGELPMPDDDVAADRYQLADELLEKAGFRWYEVSNWATSDEARCLHNLLYWTGGDWWAAGPGAHSHVGGTRWWNVKHPAAYARRLAEGASPAHAREVLTADDRETERLMLELRLASGYPLADVAPGARTTVATALGGGLLEPESFKTGRLVLTLKGRLLADALVRDLVS
ncbi:radical SAM family heme chaperone HemW [Nonomuraea cavernae]|uniref:Heme chaperone HemW n=1 Tax=Nonomuraea cavernae TaxID=2045107 RepID=A0A917YTW3_9ACTN|nr:radical SAM family heme chaperone HemW [Nonomuraea cavernae]MCA2185363.1 radical SAM family heme chaperone HemW [Nonomuraea cavernae]GGO66242.1 coproporphyrinogen III oxidase [Nonomuraea cavernae]